MCRFNGCDRPTKAKGLCRAHYNQQWRGEELRAIRARVSSRFQGDHIRCPGCATWKRESFFLKDRSGRPQSLCRGCDKDRHLRRTFRVDRQWFEDKSSDGCNACGSKSPGGRYNWHVDHDRSCCPGRKSCGECVRGTLCWKCNIALGAANDSIERLKALIRYLERN